MGNNRSVYVRIGKKARFFVLHHRGFFQLYDCMVRYEQFSGIAMFDGVLGIVFKCVVGAFLLGFVLIYVIGKLKKNKK